MKRLLPLLLLCGCAAPQVSLSAPPRAPGAADYSDAYERYTRSGRAISKSELDTTLLIYATLRAPEFEEAYVARYLQFYALQGAEAEAFRKEQRDRSAESLMFLVQTAGHSYGFADLAPGKSLWRVVLQDDAGHVVAPSKVEEIRTRDSRRDEVLLNPALTGAFARSFNLSFPRTAADGAPLWGPQTRRLTLTLVGPQGRIDLNWSLR